MSCQDVRDFLDAYIDEELDVMASSHFTRHLAECVECRTRYKEYRQMHESVQPHIEYYRTPEAVEQQLRARLTLRGKRESRIVDRTKFGHWRHWTWAAGVAVVLLFTALVIQLVKGSSEPDVLAKQVVACHVRSLLANHLNDVISSDQHTVKPWFSGKLDFAPSVKDLSSTGFPLIGGRLDYLDNRTVAALVYKRRQHTINLFMWPSTASASSLRTLGIRGYNVVHWTQSHMTYWAVSDVNAADLSDFAHDLGE